MNVRDRPDYDAIIVGASMAGCRAALTLSDQKRRILLIDKQHFPRWKPCAGGITLKAAPYIPRELQHLFECTMRGAYLTYGDRHSIHITSNAPLGWMVHREAFDLAHLALARSQPTVDVKLGTCVERIYEESGRVVVQTDSGSPSAHALIGADGVNSIVSQSLPGHADRSIGLAFEGEITAPHNRLEEDVLFDFRKFPRGYGWIFPKQHHVSVGGFIYHQSTPGMRKLYAEFCAETHSLRDHTPIRTRGHLIPHGGSYRKLNSGRIVLAGDAAELVDAMTGEGIYYALRSGHLAAEAVGRFLESNTTLDGYSTLIHDEIGRELHHARFCARLLFGWPRLCYHALFRNALVCEWLIKIMTGKMHYRDLKRALLTRGVLFPLHYKFSRQLELQVDLGE
jgi:geranylgeranyl reductase family protein